MLGPEEHSLLFELVEDGGSLEQRRPVCCAALMQANARKRMCTSSSFFLHDGTHALMLEAMHVEHEGVCTLMEVIYTHIRPHIVHDLMEDVHDLVHEI